MAKAIISSTYDDLYFWNIPLVTWAWNRLGVEVICFIPSNYTYDKRHTKLQLIGKVREQQNLNLTMLGFSSPAHKEATYAQCSRLYGACLDLPEDEVLIVGDVDMAMFKVPSYNGVMTVTGYDLVPDGQQPMCYVVGKAKEWREAFDLNGLTYQQALDRLLGEDECQDYRACRWSVDQEQLANGVKKVSHSLVRRSNGENQFASHRYDRDDAYILDRLSPDTIDYHMNRPGFDDRNFEIILTIMKYHFPDEDFQWLIDFNEQYKKLL